MQWVLDNWMLLGAVLFGISESLALIPQIKANSVFQLIYNGLKALFGAKQLPPPQS